MKMKEMNLERILGELGLEKRRTTSDFILPALGVFAAGAVVGGILGLVLAPSSGRELRGQIERKLRPTVDVNPESRERGANTHA